MDLLGVLVVNVPPTCSIGCVCLGPLEDLISTTLEILPLNSPTFPPKWVVHFLKSHHLKVLAFLDILEGTGEVYLDEANLEISSIF